MRMRDEQVSEFERVYETYGRPLEGEHWGQYLAVSPRDDWVIGDDPLSLSQQASQALGSGGYVYRIGEIDLGRIR